MTDAGVPTVFPGVGRGREKNESEMGKQEIQMSSLHLSSAWAASEQNKHEPAHVTLSGARICLLQVDVSLGPVLVLHV